MTDLEREIHDAIARFNALPLADQIAMREAQKRSWVLGEMMLEHEEMTRAEAERLYDKMIAGVDLRSQR